MKKLLYKFLPSKKNHSLHYHYTEDNQPHHYQPLPAHNINLIRPLRLRYKHLAEKKLHVATPRNDKRLAIIVPYRDRAAHLEVFVPALSDFINKQGIDYKIIIVEQLGFDKPFNRGKLKNIGFDFLKNQCDYFCFHDIDTIPEVSDYRFVSQPTLLASKRYEPAKHDFADDAEQYFGGVLFFTSEHYSCVNGYSNAYWGWGYEDDDLLLRCLFSGILPIRFIDGRYYLLDHIPSKLQAADGSYAVDDKVKRKLVEKEWKQRRKYFKAMRRGLVNFQQDGLSNLQYSIVNTEEKDGYTLLQVNV